MLVSQVATGLARQATAFAARPRCFRRAKVDAAPVRVEMTSSDRHRPIIQSSILKFKVVAHISIAAQEYHMYVCFYKYQYI